MAAPIPGVGQSTPTLVRVGCVGQLVAPTRQIPAPTLAGVRGLTAPKRLLARRVPLAVSRVQTFLAKRADPQRVTNEFGGTLSLICRDTILV